MTTAIYTREELLHDHFLVSGGYYLTLLTTSLVALGGTKIADAEQSY